MKKFEISDLGLKFDGLKGETRELAENIAKTALDVCNKALENTISAEEVEGKFKELSEKASEIEELKKFNEELVSQVKNLGETIEKLKNAGLSMDTINKLDEKIAEMLDSEKFKDFASGNTRKSGVFDGFSLKGIVNMTGSYTGDHLTTQQTDKVVSKTAPKKLHVRDILTVLQGDPEYPNLAFAQVYDVDRNARYVTENGTLPESSFKVKEVQTGTKRLGTHLNISKRMLKSRVYVRSYILNMLPEAVLMAEDWNILFGDGNGENLLGIANHTGVVGVEDIVTNAVATGAAGSVNAVATYNSGADTLITFTNPQPDILDGMKITFTGAASGSPLLSAQNVIKMNDRQILLRGVAYASETAANLAWAVNNAAYHSIDDPNYEDVVKTIFAVMSYAQYTTNAIVLNPITLNKIESEKDTIGRNLGLVTLQNGVKYIAGIPVIEYNGIPADKYLVGDFATAANLVDYTSLTLEWAEDVNSKLANQVTLIAQEEVIFPVYMPWAFAYGDLGSVKTAIAVPS